MSLSNMPTRISQDPREQEDLACEFDESEVEYLRSHVLLHRLVDDYEGDHVVFSQFFGRFTE